jgi:hypothetical protein
MLYKEAPVLPVPILILYPSVAFPTGSVHVGVRPVTETPEADTLVGADASDDVNPVFETSRLDVVFVALDPYAEM